MISGPEKMDTYIKELEKIEKAEKHKELAQWRTLQLTKYALLQIPFGWRVHHPFKFEKKAYRFKEGTRILDTKMLTIEMGKGCLYVPVLLHRKEVGGVLKGKASIRLDTKLKRYTEETNTFITLITNEEIWKRKIERKNLEKAAKENIKELNSYLWILKRRGNLREATSLQEGSYYVWIEDAGHLGRFGLLITGEEKLRVLSNSLIRLDEVGFDVQAMNDITFETYSETNTTLKVNGTFSAGNDIKINCNLKAEKVMLKNDITIRGDITVNKRISIRNDAHILGEVETKVFEGSNDIKIKGNIRAEIIKVKNDIKFLSDVCAERFEGSNDIYIGGDAEVKFFKCSNDCTIRGNLITLHCSTRHAFNVHGKIIPFTQTTQ